MQRGYSLILILAGIVVIMALVGGAYYLGRSNTPKLSPNPVITSEFPKPSPTAVVTSETPVPTPVSSLFPDETANWPVYKNSTFGFQLKYPPNWLVHEQPKDQYRALDLSIIPNRGDTASSLQANPNVKFAGTGELNIEINTTIHDQSVLQKKGEDSPNLVGFKYEPIIFMELQANKSYMLWTDTIPGEGSTNIRFNKKQYGWTINYPNTDFKGNHDSVYDQILSTFKFINQILR